MSHEMQLLRFDDLEPDAPAGHWGVASRFLERADERLTVQVCEMTPDGGAEPHAHDAHDQMFVVLEGALIVLDGTGGDVLVRRGEALRIPPAAVHATLNGGDGLARYLVLTYPAVR